LALLTRRRVRRLVALDIVPPWARLPRPHPRQLGLPLLAGYQLLLATPMLGPRALTSGTGLVRTVIRAGSGRRARWTDTELDTYARVLREPARARASSACYRTFLTRELPGLLQGGDRSSDLQVPSLLIMGGASLIQRLLAPQPGPNLEVKVISGAGHFLPEEAPDDVRRLSEDWLD
jgi:pimeloyl-ACP methyl ester carboxylesterase